MNFISLTFVFSFPVVVLLYWKNSMEIQRTLSTGCELFLLHKKKVPGQETASAYNGNHVSGGNCC